MTETEFEFEPGIAHMLELFAPPVDRRGDWHALVAKARSRRPKARFGLAVAAAVAAAVVLALATPLGGAVRDVVADFSDWIAGTPGSPVSDDEQREFDEQNARSWDGFPGSPKLRRLIRAETGGTTFDLVGFRSGGSLCLRVRATGTAAGSELTCAPVAELRNDDAPARVLLADWGVGRGEKRETIGFDVYTAPRTQVTAGIAADGVDAIELTDDRGTHRVAVKSNAFLFVADTPDVGQRVSRVRAELVGGAVVGIPFEASSFGPVPGVGGSGEPAGPTRVDRQVHGGLIGWFEQREPRGGPIDDAMRKRIGFRRVEFGRVLTPDPGDARRVVLAVGAREVAMPGREGQNVCYTLVGRGTSAGSCGSLESLFAHAPFTFGYFISGVGAQYAAFAGVTSDEVERLELFTATGNRVDVPLHDNAYLADVALARLPAKLVAYDRDGRVVGIERTGGQERAQRITPEQVVDLSATVPGVGALELRANRTREGGQCWAARGTGDVRANTGSCIPANWTFAPLRLGFLPEPPVFVFGRVRDDVASLTFRYADGKETRVRPRDDGYLLTVIPEAHRDAPHRLIEIVGRGGDGHVVDQVRLGR